MAIFAAGGAFAFLRWSGIPEGISGLFAMVVLLTAGYFLAIGVETHDRKATKEREEQQSRIIGYKGPGFPKDPFAPQ